MSDTTQQSTAEGLGSEALRLAGIAERYGRQRLASAKHIRDVRAAGMGATLTEADAKSNESLGNDMLTIAALLRERAASGPVGEPVAWAWLTRAPKCEGWDVCDWHEDRAVIEATIASPAYRGCEHAIVPIPAPPATDSAPPSTGESE